MSWLFEKRGQDSLKNGRIVIQKILGRWSVHVGNSTQSSEYTERMFTDAFKKISTARLKPIRSALMLGLGGGSGIRPLHSMFDSCVLTVVEHDPNMIEVARGLHWYDPYPFPKVVQADANEALQDLVGPYDLIALDLFEKRALSPLVTDVTFLEKLRVRLSSRGILLVNVSRHGDALQQIEKIFPHNKTWMFRSNALGAFW